MWPRVAPWACLERQWVWNCSSSMVLKNSKIQRLKNEVWPYTCVGSSKWSPWTSKFILPSIPSFSFPVKYSPVQCSWVHSTTVQLGAVQCSWLLCAAYFSTELALGGSNEATLGNHRKWQVVTTTIYTLQLQLPSIHYSNSYRLYTTVTTTFYTLQL